MADFDPIPALWKPGLNLYENQNPRTPHTCKACGSEFETRSRIAYWCPLCKTRPLGLRRRMQQEREK